MRLENQTINTVPFAICKVQLKMVNNKSIFAWFAKNKPTHYLFINKSNSSYIRYAKNKRTYCTFITIFKVSL